MRCALQWASIEMEEQQGYQLELGVFEGPLDLLLHLIDKNELNIYDVPIHLLAEQYVVYLESLENLDMEVASEFLIVAAQLMYAKSKALLPQIPKESDESEEDIEEKLRFQLLEYRAFKNASAYFLEILGNKKYFSRAPGELPIRTLELEPQSSLLLLEARKILQTGEVSLFAPQEVLEVEPFNIEERISQLEQEIYAQPQRRMSLSHLMKEQKGRIAWLISILAVLELVRMKRLAVVQDAVFSEIYLSVREGEGVNANEQSINSALGGDSFH